MSFVPFSNVTSIIPATATMRCTPPPTTRTALTCIQQLDEGFSAWGNCFQGVAHIRCTNSECRQNDPTPFLCKAFHLHSPCIGIETNLSDEVSRLMYDILRELCHVPAGRPLRSVLVLAHEMLGDTLRGTVRHLVKIGPSPPGFDSDRFNGELPPPRSSRDVYPFGRVTNLVKLRQLSRLPAGTYAWRVVLPVCSP